MSESVIRHPKLVRDKIPELIIANGEDPKTRILDSSEFPGYAAAKICEEAQEIAIARVHGNREEMVKELADLFEAADAFMKAVGIDKDEVYRTRLKKARTHGRFEKRILLEAVEKTVQ